MLGPPQVANNARYSGASNKGAKLDVGDDDADAVALVLVAVGFFVVDVGDGRLLVGLASVGLLVVGLRVDGFREVGLFGVDFLAVVRLVATTTESQ